ncbi:hypothetical protein BGX21_004037 [Mortierella sp. AD011]|nr:hypothetical protein BGX20_003356 [Mortierella sp. AD010]KAF9400560.1 hypothetical protein BGX21_004037 [Mortierella sp. AD011]
MHSCQLRNSPLEFQQDPEGKYYYLLNNVQDIFPGETRFRVNGTFVLPSPNENENENESMKIKYYPDNMDGAVNAMGHSILGPSDSNTQGQINGILSQCQCQAQNPTPGPSFGPSPPMSPSLELTRGNSFGTQSRIIQQQVANFADNQLEFNQQILRSLAESEQRDLEASRQLVEVLKKQLESEERERKILEEQLKQKEMLQQANDRMVLLQRSIEAVLVQNYELHEYPIPRRFVVLPEKFARKVIRSMEDSWDDTKSSVSTDDEEDQEGLLDMIKNYDPRNLLEERFRLYFLCECGDPAESGTGNSSTCTSTQSTTNTKNKVHLAKHDGYQLSRPTHFLKRYGPYVLGMLQILRFCLDVAKFVAPVVGLARESLDNVVDDVKSISEQTLDAVNFSIATLEEVLGRDNNIEALYSNSDGNDIFKNLAALEGADLRQLETFLRNKDKDKILGNLYRTTTSEGHVKWVCLEHFEKSYRDNAARSFINAIATNHGFYDENLRKITMTLSSPITTNDFMKQLITYSFTTDELDLTLDFGFNYANLAKIVKKLERSNVKILKLDLKDTESTRPDFKVPGMEKYQPLLELMSNRKLQQLTLTGIDYFGSRTSDLPRNREHSKIRSFHHLNSIRTKDIPRLVNILSCCSNLVDLRLGSHTLSMYQLELGCAIGALSQLEVLHLIGLDNENEGNTKTYTEVNGNQYEEGILSKLVEGKVKLRELVVTGDLVCKEDLDKAMHAFESTLETLVIESHLTWVGLCSERFKHRCSFPKLTHLHAPLKEMKETLHKLQSTLGLNLSHLGVIQNDIVLKEIANLTALRSVSIHNINASDLLPLWESFPENGGSLHIDSLSLRLVGGCEDSHFNLMVVSLRRLWLEGIDQQLLEGLLKKLDFSNLEILAVIDCGFPSEVELALVARQSDFSKHLEIHLGEKDEKKYQDGGDNIWVSIHKPSSFEPKSASSGTALSTASSGKESSQKLDPRRVIGSQDHNTRYLWYQLMN